VQAADRFRKAGELGEAESWMRLGAMHEGGQGHARDLSLASRCYHRAAAAGLASGRDAEERVQTLLAREVCYNS
jgi:TPR repeat protein